MTIAIFFLLFEGGLSNGKQLHTVQDEDEGEIGHDGHEVQGKEADGKSRQLMDVPVQGEKSHSKQQKQFAFHVKEAFSSIRKSFDNLSESLRREVASQKKSRLHTRAYHVLSLLILFEGPMGTILKKLS